MHFDSVLGLPVLYTPHAEYSDLAQHKTLAAIVGREQGLGIVDLMVFVPQQGPRWVESVPQGEGPHTWHHVWSEVEQAEADEPEEITAHASTPGSAATGLTAADGAAYAAAQLGALEKEPAAALPEGPADQATAI